MSFQLPRIDPGERPIDTHSNCNNHMTDSIYSQKSYKQGSQSNCLPYDAYKFNYFNPDPNKRRLWYMIKGFDTVVNAEGWNWIYVMIVFLFFWGMVILVWGAAFYTEAPRPVTRQLVLPNFNTLAAQPPVVAGPLLPPPIVSRPIVGPPPVITNTASDLRSIPIVDDINNNDNIRIGRMPDTRRSTRTTRSMDSTSSTQNFPLHQQIDDEYTWCRLDALTQPCLDTGSYAVPGMIDLPSDIPRTHKILGVACNARCVPMLVESNRIEPGYGACVCQRNIRFS